MSQDSFSDLLKNSGHDPEPEDKHEDNGDTTGASNSGEGDPEHEDNHEHENNGDTTGASNSGEGDPAATNLPAGINSAPAIINTAYVEREEKSEDEFDLERDGAGDGERREVKMGFNTVAHMDPARQRDPHGVYLDDQRRRDAETVRAQVEGRDPDYDNPPYTAGDYVVAEHVAQQHAQVGTVVTAEKELPVIVGDHYPDEDGDESLSDEDRRAVEDENK